MATNPVDKDDPAYIGNELFILKEYEKALDGYSKSIEKHPNMAKLYSNRAMTYWKLNRPYDAWKDAEAGLKLLIYRKCTALLEIRRFHEASQFLDEGLKRMGGVPEKYANEFKTLIDDMNRLKVEYIEGRYDLMVMVEESKTSPILSKHADYIAWNKFEIREIEGKGRGLVAKERIELGELLIACEALVFVPIPDSEETPSVFIMMGDIRKKLLHRPDLGEQFYRLYAGPQLGHLDNWVEGEPMDLERIDGIIEHNFFTYRDVLFEGTTESEPHHFGINFVTSYINHTCIDFNCARYFAGNFTFVRATRAIEKGEELLISYYSHDIPFEIRQRCTRGFECHCRLCQIERHDSVGVKNRLKEIRQLLEYVFTRMFVTGVSHPNVNDVQRLERCGEELRGYRAGLNLDYLSICIREAVASSVAYSDPKASIPLWKELIEELKSAGDFLEALYLTKALKHVAMESASQREQGECNELARGIAKMFFHDERVADLKK